MRSHSEGKRDRWENWVPTYFTVRYERKPKSALRYGLAWKNLFAYMTKTKISCPAQLTYTACMDYFSFRKKGDPESGVFKGSHNTILLELKFLNMLMREAMRRGFASANPLSGMGIGRLDPKEKPEIKDEDIPTILAALEKQPPERAWMKTAFLIGYCSGCRLSETRIAMTALDLERKRMTFRGKGNKVFEVPIHDALLPYLVKLKAEGRTHTCNIPSNPSKYWTNFFKAVNMPQYCFHCLRVTFITRAARAGLQERDVMKLVNHASTTIHRVYQRMRADDLESPLNRIPMPVSPAQSSTSQCEP